MSRAKRQPTATELEVLGNCITSVSRPAARQVRVKCAKDTGQQVFNILSQCLKYTSYTKGTGWGDFRMWFGSAEYGRQAKEDIDGWLAQYAVNLLEKRFRSADGKFITLAAHGFDEDGKVHFTASAYAEAFGSLGIGNAEGNIL